MYKPELPADNVILAASPPYRPSPDFAPLEDRPYVSQQHRSNVPVAYLDPRHSVLTAGVPSPSVTSGFDSRVSSPTLGQAAEAQHRPVSTLRDSGLVERKPAAELQG